MEIVSIDAASSTVAGRKCAATLTGGRTAQNETHIVDFAARISAPFVYQSALSAF
jgi:hypothetical protein